MTFIFDKIYERIYRLSNRINSLYEIDPKIFIEFGLDQYGPEGFCATPYKVPDMNIEIVLPEIYILSHRNEAFLDVLLCHEYCHYIEALTLSAVERQRTTYLYEDDLHTRKLDEQKTWRQTRALAKRLGLWDKQFYKCIRTYRYASWLKY